MTFLIVALYDTEDGPRYKVMEPKIPDPVDPVMADVTEQYIVAATTDDVGQEGWVVLRRQEEVSFHG